MALEFETLKEKNISKDDMCYIILKNKAFCLYDDVPLYEMDICGRKILEWTKSACIGNKIFEVEYSIQDNVFDLIRKNVKGGYAVACVLYADTPLLSKVVMQDIWNMFVKSNERICRLPRGFIMEIDALKKGVNMLEIKKIGEMFSREFLPINNLFAYLETQKVMQDRILTYHMENGVIFRDSTGVHIDADVEIGSGTVIFPNNFIYDKSEIGEKCVLLPNNTIIASKIGKKCELKGAYIEKSEIGNGKIIPPFESIIENN